MADDVNLLRRFVTEKSEAAFRELVARRIDFVYTAALRQVGGDAHLAQEVAQSVFLDLACKGSALATRPTLTGWLYTSTRFAAAKALRSRARRVNHETEAHTMQQILTASSAAEIDWNELRPVIDEAMHELGESDREAILLRYFEDRPLAEVGAAIGLAENSARMRVERALEKLRTSLARRGITSTAVALSATLANQPTVAAPAGLAVAIADVSFAEAAGAAAHLESIISFMSNSKIIIAVIALGLAFLAGRYFGGERDVAATVDSSPLRAMDEASVVAALRSDNTHLKETIDRLETERAMALAESAQARAKLAEIEARLQAVEVVREKEVRVQKQKTMLNNLRQIAAARDQLLFESGRVPTMAELIGPNKIMKALNPADGEDYSNLDLSNNTVLSVTSPSGVSIAYYVAPPGEIQAPLGKALRAYQDAHKSNGPPPAELRTLAAYFENPKEAADFIEWLDANTPRH